MNTIAPGAIQSVQRAVEVLFCFDPTSPSLTVGEIAGRLHLNRTTAWRYLRSLAESGLVRELGDSGRYVLGSRVVGLADAYNAQWGDLMRLARPVLRELRDTTNETAALHVREGWARIVVSQVESLHELHRIYRDVGQPIPLHSGAPSVAILAWLTEEEQDHYLNSHIEPPSSVPSVKEELRQVRESGYAVSRQARTSNVGSVAAPIRMPDGAVMASINVSGPLERFDDESVETLAAQVKRAAKEIERRTSSTLQQS